MKPGPNKWSKSKTGANERKNEPKDKNASEKRRWKRLKICFTSFERQKLLTRPTRIDSGPTLFPKTGFFQQNQMLRCDPYCPDSTVGAQINYFTPSDPLQRKKYFR
jgi:hypothetical protein